MKVLITSTDIGYVSHKHTHMYIYIYVCVTYLYEKYCFAVRP